FPKPGWSAASCVALVSRRFHTKDRLTSATHDVGTVSHSPCHPPHPLTLSSCHPVTTEHSTSHYRLSRDVPLIGTLLGIEECRRLRYAIDRTSNAPGGSCETENRSIHDHYPCRRRRVDRGSGLHHQPQRRHGSTGKLSHRG